MYILHKASAVPAFFSCCADCTIKKGVVYLEAVKEFIDAFFGGMKSVSINLFNYSFTLWDIVVAAAVVSIIGYFLYRYFNG